MFFFFNNDPVTNNPNSTNLQYIKINGLFSRSNITLTFDDEVNIYIGENGLGKTTVLNCVYLFFIFYYTITQSLIQMILCFNCLSYFNYIPN